MRTCCTGQVAQAILALDFGEQPVRHIGVYFELHPEPEGVFTGCGVGREGLAIVCGDPEVEAGALEENSFWVPLVKVEVQDT